MPSESCLQFSGCVCTVPAQQRSVASHEFVESRQMDPAGLHALPLSQRPTVPPPAGFSQWTSVLFIPPLVSVDPAEPFAPQQSASC